MNKVQKQYCQALGIHSWVQRNVTAVNSNIPLMLVTDTPLEVDTEQYRLVIAMLKSIGLDLQHVQLSAISQKDPNFIHQAILDAKPHALLAAGNKAANDLLKTKATLESLRLKTHTYSKQNIPVVVTHEPAYLLQHPAEKKNTFADLQLALRVMTPVHQAT